VNLFYHPEAFATLDVAFDPEINAQAAARILTRSQGAGGSWEGAIALYHSATPVLGANYLRQVQAVWPWAKTRSAMSAEIGPDAYAALLSPAARQVRVLSGREVTQPGALPMPRVVDWPGTSPACSGMKSIACMPRVVDWPGTLPVPASAPAPSMVSHPSAPVATPVAAAPVAPVVATPVAAGDCIVGASSGRQTRRCGRGDRRGDRLEPAADWRGTHPLSPVGRSLQMTR
jgi:hypothetical protein